VDVIELVVVCVIMGDEGTGEGVGVVGVGGSDLGTVAGEEES
jgi:hypothetical protein